MRCAETELVLATFHSAPSHTLQQHMQCSSTTVGYLHAVWKGKLPPNGHIKACYPAWCDAAAFAEAQPAHTFPPCFTSGHGAQFLPSVQTHRLRHHLQRVAIRPMRQRSGT